MQFTRPARGIQQIKLFSGKACRGGWQVTGVLIKSAFEQICGQLRAISRACQRPIMADTLEHVTNIRAGLCAK
jgi:hypothetical protein